MSLEHNQAHLICTLEAEINKKNRKNGGKPRFFYFLFVLVSLTVVPLACSKNDKPEIENEGSGALSSAKGHSFQFYGKTNWMFSVHVSDAGKITTAVSTGTLYGNNIFDYHQISDREATCLVSVGFSFTFGGNTYYDAYAGDMVLTFTSSKGGCFSMHNSMTGENWKGSFTIDDTERETPPTNSCWSETPSGDIVKVTSVALNKNALSLIVGTKEILTASVSPTDATDKSVTWNTSAANIANISSTGEITGVSAGTATITVTTNSNAKTATCTVNVTSGNNGGEVDPWVDDPNIDVYVAGQEEYQATLWKNGVSQRLTNSTNVAEAYSVFVSDNDVYVAGRTNSDKATLWKNGISKNLHNHSYYESFAQSVFVSGSDVYVGGSSYNGGSGYDKATIWKNGERIMLINSLSIIASSVNSIFVSGNDIYAVGSERSTLNVISACLWKNNELRKYSDRNIYANLKDVFVLGDDIYSVGYERIDSKDIATLWKNGIPQRLSDGQNSAYAYSVFISGSDVYVAGCEKIGSKYVAIVWKNGVQQKLTDGQKDAYARSIFVINNDVYVAGNNGTSGIVWKNGIPRVLGNYNVYLNSVFVVRK